MQFWIETKPYGDTSFCGDQCLVKNLDGERTMVAVVDGLGHGVWASEAAEKALRYVGEHSNESLTDIITECDKHLRDTVGVVMGLAVVDESKHLITFARVGNIGIRLAGATKAGLVSDYGIVGGGFRKVREETREFAPRDMLLMYSDGISEKFTVDEFPANVQEAPQKLARAIMEQFGRDNDDAIIVVAKFDRVSGTHGSTENPAVTPDVGG